MTVQELIEILQGVEDKEREVVVSMDEEGNGFRPVHQIDANSLFDPTENEVGIETLTPELREQGYCEEDLGCGTPCIVIW